MLQRSGAQGAGKIDFVQNNFYHDAFFLKAQGKTESEKSFELLADGF